MPYGPSPGTEIEVILRYGGIEFQVTKGIVRGVSLDFEESMEPPVYGERWEDAFERSRLEVLRIKVERTY